MEYQDKILKCIDCGSDFVFTAGEQLFFHDKQFKNEPKRCKNCKGKRVAVLGLVHRDQRVGIHMRKRKPARTVRSVEKRLRYRSDQRKDGPCCAANVSSMAVKLPAPDISKLCWSVQVQPA